MVVGVAPTREEEPPAWRERDMMMIIKTTTGRRRREGMVENKDQGVTTARVGLLLCLVLACWYS
jgi:hypothetical protein